MGAVDRHAGVLEGLLQLRSQGIRRVSGNVVVRPAAPGVKQEPPLPVSVELARNASDPAGLADSIRERVRSVLLVQTAVELVPWGSLPRSEYKSRLVERNS